MRKKDKDTEMKAHKKLVDYIKNNIADALNKAELDRIAYGTGFLRWTELGLEAISPKEVFKHSEIILSKTIKVLRK